MYDVVGSLKGLLKLDEISIDNNVFKLHYKCTTFILVLFSVLVTQKQYFGDPIDCIVSEIDPDIMDIYCWIHSTFTLPDLPNQIVGETVPHVGISNPSKHGPDDGHEIKHHKYYQWVTLFLFFIAILFYLPRQIWKSMEGGILKMLVKKLNNPILDEETKNDQKAGAVEYVSMNLHNHRWYAFKFIFCELLNCVHVFFELWFINLFLGYEFTTYGTDVLNHMNADLYGRIDPMDRVFPKVTKCTFHKYGPSGTVERHDGLCVLPLNIFNEKIFVFLWFWLIIVGIVSLCGIIYRMLTLWPKMRFYLLCARARLVPREVVEAVNRKCHFGDWFLIYQLAKNMDHLVFKEFLTDLANKLHGRDQMS